MRFSRVARVACVLPLIALTACGDDGPTSTSAELSGPAEVAFVMPADGAVVSSPVEVTMRTAFVGIEPAGEVRDGAGHLHIMINVPCVEVGEVIPADDAHRHFGGAQMATELELEPGDYTLCLQMADGAHVAAAQTHIIEITVE